MGATPQARADGQEQTGVAVCKIFLDDYTGYLPEGIQLCIENALRSRGYNWRVFVTRADFVTEHEEDLAEIRYKKLCEPPRRLLGMD